MFPLGSMFFVLLEQLLQEIEKSWKQWENWYQVGLI